MTDAPVLMWFRRDLRLQDNLAFAAAVASGAPVLPIFVLDPGILSSEKTCSPRLQFLLNALKSLDAALAGYGTRLLLRHGDPYHEIPHVMEATGVTALYFNRDYTPFARKRDTAIRAAIQAPSYGFDDALLNAPGEVLKEDGEPYKVFTPFKRTWLEQKRHEGVHIDLDKVNFLPVPSELCYDMPSLDDLGYSDAIPLPEASESAAMKHLERFMDGNIYHYKKARNRLVAKPWADTRPGSSYLSPYLRLGLLSPRQVYWAARSAYQSAEDRASREAVESYVNELVWRDFYMHIMHFFPHAATGNFRPEYDALEWDDNPDALRAWQQGQTGYPIVDAAMRQLNAIGWMPNRARMIVASFLTKDLLIDWREGERYFMQRLIDGDPAANNGGWQWAAGTGTDAQPYFRIFNPTSQSKKFDPDGEYIRYWIPELRDVPGKFMHTPWEMAEAPADYPTPIVDHKSARERTLAAYKQAKEQ